MDLAIQRTKNTTLIKYHTSWQVSCNYQQTLELVEYITKAFFKEGNQVPNCTANSKFATLQVSFHMTYPWVIISLQRKKQLLI